MDHLGGSSNLLLYWKLKWGQCIDWKQTKKGFGNDIFLYGSMASLHIEYNTETGAHTNSHQGLGVPPNWRGRTTTTWEDEGWEIISYLYDQCHSHHTCCCWTWPAEHEEWRLAHLICHKMGTFLYRLCNFSPQLLDNLQNTLNVSSN